MIQKPEALSACASVCNANFVNVCVRCKCVFVTQIVLNCVCVCVCVCVRVCVFVARLQLASRAVVLELVIDFLFVVKESAELQDDGDDVEGTRSCVYRC